MPSKRKIHFDTCINENCERKACVERRNPPPPPKKKTILRKAQARTEFEMSEPPIEYSDNEIFVP